MARDWRFCVTGPNDFDVEAEVPWRTAKIGWVLNSPGYIEVDLMPDDISDAWTPGNHRILACTGGVGIDYAWQACYLTHLSQFGPPGDVRFRGAGVGLESIFDWRIVHNEWAGRMTVVEHLEVLMNDLQVLQGGGDMGFDNAVIGTSGGAEPLLSTCLGVVAGDFIRELAVRGVGFDWTIDIYETPPALKIYKPRRGGSTPLVSIAPENCQAWTVEFDTSDLLTTVTAIGEQSDPFGPRHNLARTSLGDLYGRHEVVFDTDIGGEDDADEVRDRLYEAASEELAKRAGARLQVRAQFIRGTDDAPWTSLSQVWLGDVVTVELPSYFGGNQDMRCTELSVSLETAGVDLTGEGTKGLEVMEYVFDTLVEDITEGAESS